MAGYRKMKKAKKAKKTVDKSALSKPERAAVKALIKGEVEQKFYSIPWQNTAGSNTIWNAVSNNSSMFVANILDIAQGVGRSDRIGAQVKVHSIKFDGVFRNNFTQLDNMVRLCLVQSDTFTTLTDNPINIGWEVHNGTRQNYIYKSVKDSLREIAPFALNEGTRVLMDKTFHLEPFGGGGVNGVGSKMMHHFKKTVKINQKSSYLPAQIFPYKNLYYLVMNISQDVPVLLASTDGVYFDGSIEVNFTDA